MSNQKVLIKLLNQYHYSLEEEMLKIEEKLKQGISFDCGQYVYSPTENEHFAFFMYFYGLSEDSKAQLINSHSDWLDLTEKVPLFANDVIELRVTVGKKEVFFGKNNLEMMNHYSVTPEADFASSQDSKQSVKVEIKLVKEGSNREEFKRLMFDPSSVMLEYQEELSYKFKGVFKNSRPLFKYSPAFFKERLKFWNFEAEESQVEKYLEHLDLSNFNITDVAEMTCCLDLFMDPRISNEKIKEEMKKSVMDRKNKMNELIKTL